MTRPSDDACGFLESLQRFDLSVLVKPCRVDIIKVKVDNGWFEDVAERALIEAPKPIDDALNALPSQDRRRIAEAIASLVAVRKAPEDILVRSSDGVISGAPALLAELIIHREMMIDVATGGKRIQEVNDYYRAREVRIKQQMPEGIEYKNPHGDLWDWYHNWKSNFPSYGDRRSFVRQTFGPTIDALAIRPAAALPLEREPTGWERVDRALSTARSQFGKASAAEDFQGIGLLCREIIISLAQAVFQAEKHMIVDEVKASETDANRMLEAYIAHEFPGASYKEVRAHARASLALALNLQHRRTATKQLAALCLEATLSTAAVISIIARSSAPDSE